MRRGEIYYANLAPPIGSPSSKRRPVPIVGNDANSGAAGTVTVFPITSNAAPVYPFEVSLKPSDSDLPKSSKAHAQPIRTIAKERIRGKARGEISGNCLREVEAAIRLDLGF